MSKFLTLLNCLLSLFALISVSFYLHEPHIYLINYLYFYLCIAIASLIYGFIEFMFLYHQIVINILFILFWLISSLISSIIIKDVCNIGSLKCENMIFINVFAYLAFITRILISILKKRKNLNAIEPSIQMEVIQHEQMEVNIKMIPEHQQITLYESDSVKSQKVEIIVDVKNINDVF